MFKKLYTKFFNKEKNVDKDERIENIKYKMILAIKNIKNQYINKINKIYTENILTDSKLLLHRDEKTEILITQMNIELDRIRTKYLNKIKNVK